MPLRAGQDFSDYTILPKNHAWLLEDMTMSRLVRLPRSRWWSLALTLAALLALSACGDSSAPKTSGGPGNTVTVTPTVAVPASWQTYHDTPSAYSIQYPPGWASMLEPEPQGAPYEVVGFFAAGTASNGTAPTQNVITITSEQSRPDTVDSAAPPGYAPGGSITVAGTSQTLFVGPGSTGTGQGLVVLMAQGNQIFLFYSTADAASAAQFKQTFLQMLTSFQLLAAPQG
jgi:hypothetical protein